MPRSGLSFRAAAPADRLERAKNLPLTAKFDRRRLATDDRDGLRRGGRDGAGAVVRWAAAAFAGLDASWHWQDVVRTRLAVLAGAAVALALVLAVATRQEPARTDTRQIVAPMAVPLAVDVTDTADKAPPADKDTDYPAPTLQRRHVPVPVGRLAVGSGLAFASPGDRATIPPELFAFVAEGWVFLRETRPENLARWGTGVVQWRLEDDKDYPEPPLPGHAFGRQAIDGDRLPTRWTDWQGRLLMLGRGADAQCHARVVELALVVRTSVEGSQNDRYKGMGVLARQAALTQYLWGKSPVWLAARVEPQPGQDCKDATWARDGYIDLPASLSTELIPCEHAEIRKLWPLIVGSATVKDWTDVFSGPPRVEGGDVPGTWAFPDPDELMQIRRDIAENDACVARWTEGGKFCDGPSIGASCAARRFVDGTRSIVAWEIRIATGAMDDRAGFESSGSFSGAALLVEAANPTSIRLERASRYGRIEQAIDFDGDGVVEWFGAEHLWRLPAGKAPEHFTIDASSP